MPIPPGGFPQRTWDFVARVSKASWRRASRAKGKDRTINTKHLLIAALVGGLVTAFLSNVIIVNCLDLVICVDFWVGPMLAVWVYRHYTRDVSLRQGIVIGTLAGFVAAVPSLIIALLRLAQAPGLLQSYPGYVPIPAGFAVPVDITWLFLRVPLHVAFGAFGGLLGGAIFRTRDPKAPGAA